MWRRRQMEGTLDEIGTGPQNVEHVIAAAFAAYPSEDEYKAHQRAQEQCRRGEFVR